MRHFVLSRTNSCPDLDNKSHHRFHISLRSNKSSSRNDKNSDNNNHKVGKRKQRHSPSAVAATVSSQQQQQQQNHHIHHHHHHNDDLLNISTTESAPLPIRRSSMRVHSLDDSLHCDGLTHYSSTSPSTSITQRNVSFGSVRIRDYERSVGDNPSVTRGVPISLGWEFRQYQDIPLESYEASAVRRTKNELIMSPEDRFLILKNEWQIPQREIASAVRRTIKTRNQRRQTVVSGGGNETWDMIRSSLKHQVFKKWGSSASSRHDKNIQDFMNQCSDAMQMDDLDQTRHKSIEMPDFLIKAENDIDAKGLAFIDGGATAVAASSSANDNEQSSELEKEGTVKPTLSSTGTDDHDEDGIAATTTTTSNDEKMTRSNSSDHDESVESEAPLKKSITKKTTQSTNHHPPESLPKEEQAIAC